MTIPSYEVLLHTMLRWFCNPVYYRLTCLIIGFELIQAAYGKDIAYPPGLTQYYYYESGDVLLGGALPIHKYLTTEGYCHQDLNSVTNFYAFKFVLDAINANDSILPGVKLGAIVVDSCRKESTLLAQAIRFLPTEPLDGEDMIPKIAGLVGPEKSSGSIQIAPLMMLYEIPQISYASSSDALSDKKRYSYFFRTILPDRFQTRAMINVAFHFNWTYVSLIWLDDPYAKNGAKYVRKAAEERGICFALQRMILYTENTDEDFDSIANELIQYRNARVVILYMFQPYPNGIMRALRRRKVLHHFIFFSSDAWGTSVEELGENKEVAKGMIGFLPFHKNSKEIFDYVKNLKIEEEMHIPWFAQYWEEYHDCSLSDVSTLTNKKLSTVSSGRAACTGNETLLHHPPLTFGTVVVENPIYVFADAFHQIREKDCPGAVGEELRRCITGKRLRKKLQTGTFHSPSGDIRFDESGDVKGKYQINNLIRRENGEYEFVRLGYWDSESGQLHLDYHLLQWPTGNHADGVPESVCSQPCPPRHYRLQHEVQCCWDCRACEPNEYLSDDGFDCFLCPMFYWPDEDNGTTCVEVALTYLRWSNPLAALVVTLSSVGIVSSIFIAFLFVKNKDHKLIKACSRELSVIMWVGIVASCLVVFAMLKKPTNISCDVTHFGFPLSFTLIYSPLLSRTNRIYRIFASGQKQKRPPRFTRPQAQCFFSLILINIQVVLCILWATKFPPEATKVMRSRLENYVELTCHAFPPAFLTSLSYNVLLCFSCSYYAFRTRKLPDNFNESRFISFCVYTTLVMWLAFIPSYYVGTSAIYQTACLTFALIINALVCLVCLFASKLYALYFVIERDLNVVGGTTFHTVLTTTVSTFGNRNKVFHSENTQITNIAPVPEPGTSK